jgi:hypothetical protein
MVRQVAAASFSTTSNQFVALGAAIWTANRVELLRLEEGYGAPGN